MKHFAVIAFVCVAQALAGPALRDLAADVNSAETNLARWDAEINSFQSRINAFSDELSITITDIYNDIKTNLPLTGIDAETESTLVGQIDANLATSSGLVGDTIAALSELRTQVIATNEALQGDLTALAGVVDTLSASYNSTNLVISSTYDGVLTGFADVDTAVRQAMDGLNGTPVVQVLVSLQRVTDIIDNERFELTNAQILYEFRADESFAALQVVIDQV